MLLERETPVVEVDGSVVSELPPRAGNAWARLDTVGA